MTTSYKARERALIEQLAFATIQDPKASPDDVRAARARLEGGGGLNYERLTPDEYDVLEHLVGKTAGHDASPVELVHLERVARALADEAKARVDAEEARLAAIAEAAKPEA